MADDSQDIFGKIDAMLGKRAGFSGMAQTLEDEFPMLTEVVAEGLQTTTTSIAEALSAVPPAPAPAPAGPAEGDMPHLSEIDIDRLAAALEARLSELFIRQQLRIESLVRRVVREELDARQESKPPRL